MNDNEIANEINRLSEEEHRLEEAHVGEGLSTEESERLRTIEVALDQCWDLLRQRRARRNAGSGPRRCRRPSRAGGRELPAVRLAPGAGNRRLGRRESRSMASW